MSAASALRLPRRRPLAAACCLLAFAAAPAFAAPARPAATIAVANCADDGPGSLRAAAAVAQDGDTIDLRALGCSTITLVSGAIAIGGGVSLLGPGVDALTVDGGYASRVFDHAGPGKLNLYDLTLAHGKYAGNEGARGGCIRSSGDVALADARVSGCALNALGGEAAGGGVFAAGQVELMNSVVSGNVAAASVEPARGGGIAAATLVSKYSTIEDNRVQSPSGAAYGGGAFVDGAVALLGTTIAGNEAAVAAGLVAGTDAQQPASILDSTVSGNRASDRIGGVRAGGSLVLANSTIAFNSAASGSGGLHLETGAELHSTIVADNGALDLDAATGAAVAGTANLVVHSALPLPPDTLALDPRLQPLADNGGRTRTHALGADSPALDAGDNPMQFNGDQRGMDYPRTVGAGTDIGAFERQADAERIFVDGFD